MELPESELIPTAKLLKTGVFILCETKIIDYVKKNFP